MRRRQESFARWLGRVVIVCGLSVFLFSLVSVGQTFSVTNEAVTIPEGGTARLGVKLSAEPSGTVRARVSWISGDSDITVKGNANLTFDRANSSEYQYVTLAATRDTDSENGTATIRVHRIAGDPIPYKDVTAIEDDQPGTGNCITLPRGWNLISIPVEPDDPSPKTVFDEVSPLCLYRYNGIDYDSYTSGQLTTVEALNGYWLYLSKSTRICVDGTVLTGNQLLQLGSAGWQMIGVPYPVVWGSGTGGPPGPPPPPNSMALDLPAAASPLVQSPPSVSSGSITVTYGSATRTLTEAIAAGWIYDTVWWWDNAAKVYGRATATQTTVLDPWMGYWIYAFEDDLVLNFSEMEGSSLPPPPPTSLILSLEPPPTPLLPPPLPMGSVEGGLVFDNVPNPITDLNTTTFAVTGPMAVFMDAIKVQIFDLSGRLVYENEEAGRSFDWHTENQVGEALANGVYLYKMFALVDGEWVVSETKKLAILR